MLVLARPEPRLNVDLLLLLRPSPLQLSSRPQFLPPFFLLELLRVLFVVGVPPGLRTGFRNRGLFLAVFHSRETLGDARRAPFATRLDGSGHVQQHTKSPNGISQTQNC